MKENNQNTLTTGNRFLMDMPTAWVMILSLIIVGAGFLGKLHTSMVGGFALFNDREKAAYLRRLAEARGVILLTDPDGAGFVLRSHLKGLLPPDRVKQAYVPDVYGKEKRKRKPGKEGKLGVEGMTPQVLTDALRRAGATFEGEDAPRRSAGITKADLLDKGLIGPGSAERRATLQRELGLPARLTANGLLEALDLLLTREEFDAL